MFGAKSTSNGFLGNAIALPLINVVVEIFFNELFAALPPALVRLAAWLILIVVYLVAFGALMTLIFGNRTWERTKSNLLTHAIEAIFRRFFSWQIVIVVVIIVAYLMM